MILAAAPVLAAPHVAVHPLIVVTEESRVVDESRSDFIAQAARQPIEMVSRTEVADALDKLGGSCQEQEGCLEKLCAATGATYAVLALLDLKGAKFVLEARVMAADGTVVRRVLSLEIEKDLLSPRARQVQAAFKQLFTQLDLGSLPATLPKKAAPPVAVVAPAPVVTPAPIVAAPAPAVVAPVESTDGTPPLRVAGLVIGIAGVVTAAVGGGLAGLAAADAHGIETKTIDKVTLLVHERDAPRVGPINSRATIGAGLLVGGGVAIAAGVAMLILSIDSGPHLVAAPIQGGAIVGVAGEF